MRALPDELLTGPFSDRRAHELGVSARMLTGRRFVRVLPTVWRTSNHDMGNTDLVRATQFVLLGDAQAALLGDAQAARDHAVAALVQ